MTWKPGDPLPVRVEVEDFQPGRYRPYRWRVVVGDLLTMTVAEGHCRTVEKAKAKAHEAALAYMRKDAIRKRGPLVSYEVTP